MFGYIRIFSRLDWVFKISTKEISMVTKLPMFLIDGIGDLTGDKQLFYPNVFLHKLYLGCPLHSFS
jgi:hypothetical protein